MASVTSRSPATRHTLRRAAPAALRCAAAFYAFTLVVHTADHLRRGVGASTPEVVGAGIVSTLAAIAAIALVFTKNRWAPAAAIAVGFANAFGVAAVHLLPRWSAFSDAFPGGHVDAVSWAAALLEIVGALAFGAAGWFDLRRAGRS